MKTPSLIHYRAEDDFIIFIFTITFLKKDELTWVRVKC